MHKLVMLIVILLLSAAGLQAQGMDQDTQEKIRALKIAFITDRIGLSAEESQDFWPAYNDYEAAEREIRRKYSKDKSIEQSSDDELRQRILDNFAMEEELLALKRNFFADIQDVITVRQFALLYQAERDFNKEILKRVLQNRKRRGAGN